METTIFHNIIYRGLYGVRLGDAATAQRQGGRITPEPEKTYTRPCSPQTEAAAPQPHPM